MPEVELKRLRDLRQRADALFSTLSADLKPFLDDNPEFGFRRTPRSGSRPGDVSVTTTCSCLMALAFSGQIEAFYEDEGEIALKVCENLIEAPWMSSGLTENNAFTSTLVLRLTGFLLESQVPKLANISDLQKLWEDKIEFPNSDCSNLAERLLKRGDGFTKELFELLLEPLQSELSEAVDNVKRQKIGERLSSALTKLIANTPFLPIQRQFGRNRPQEIEEEIAKPSTQYKMAHLNRLLLHDWYTAEISPLQAHPLPKIAKKMGKDPAGFGINDYPASSAVLYWFVDGIDRAGFALETESWTELCRWAQAQYLEQRSLVVARNMAMMDPVAMAMAACLCARLRAISATIRLGMAQKHLEMLPTLVELERSIIELFQEQTENGIWPKYFPLFHYQESGSNFCFTFELLEAVLHEFGTEKNTLVENELFIGGLERAVLWCERNRHEGFENKEQTKPSAYSGWNSGGILESLRRGEPESWATAVVHMFLLELREFLSVHIQKRLLHDYKATTKAGLKKNLDGLMDIPLWLDDKPSGLKQVLKDSIIKTFEGKTGSDLRRTSISGKPLSALLFGPPGTSKTQIAKAVARELNWPLVEIDPSHFLQSSFQNIYVQAEKIFEDVTDLSGVVILFDELDALVQKRDGDASPVDIESKFLTTYMLPKLAKLHDQGRVVFLMATNFFPQFDDAIKRAGRFDLLLCMGPPMLTAKCQALHEFLGFKKSTDSTTAAGEKILKYSNENVWLGQQLELYTFLEFKTFITRLGDGKDVKSDDVDSYIARKIDDLKIEGFVDEVRSDCKTAGLKFNDLRSLLDMYEATTVEELDPKPVQIAVLKTTTIDLQNPTVRYVIERRQSRRQY